HGRRAWVLGVLLGDRRVGTEGGDRHHVLFVYPRYLGEGPGAAGATDDEVNALCLQSADALLRVEGVALVVVADELNPSPADAASGVDLVHGELDAFERRHSEGRGATAEPSDVPDLDRLALCLREADDQCCESDDDPVESLHLEMLLGGLMVTPDAIRRCLV